MEGGADPAEGLRPRHDFAHHQTRPDRPAILPYRFEAGREGAIWVPNTSLQVLGLIVDARRQETHNAIRLRVETDTVAYTKSKLINE